MTERDVWRPSPSPALPLLIAAIPLVYDAYVFLGIRGGRDAFLARAGELSVVTSVIALCMLALGVLGHALLAARVVRHVPVADDARGHISAGNRRLQQLTAVVALVFLCAHQRHSVFVAGIEGIGAGGLFERIRNDCDGYPWLAVYLLGLGATALHVGQGAFAAARRGRYAPEGTRNALAFSLAGATFVAYVALTNALAAYVVGAPLFLGP